MRIEGLVSHWSAVLRMRHVQLRAGLDGKHDTSVPPMPQRELVEKSSPMCRQLTSRNADNRGAEVQETDERFVCRAFAETGMCHDRRRRVAAACAAAAWVVGRSHVVRTRQKSSVKIAKESYRHVYCMQLRYRWRRSHVLPVEYVFGSEAVA